MDELLELRKEINAIKSGNKIQIDQARGKEVKFKYNLLLFSGLILMFILIILAMTTNSPAVVAVVPFLAWFFLYSWATKRKNKTQAEDKARGIHWYG